MLNINTASENNWLDLILKCIIFIKGEFDEKIHGKNMGTDE